MCSDLFEEVVALSGASVPQLASNSFWSSYKDLCIEYLESTTSCRCGNKAFQEIESGFCSGVSEEVAVFYGCRERREMSGWSPLSWKRKRFFEYFLRSCPFFTNSQRREMQKHTENEQFQGILTSPKQTNKQSNKQGRDTTLQDGAQKTRELETRVNYKKSHRQGKMLDH